jgi:hypothetical protein
LSVKLLAIEKLRRIERALTSLHAHSYGTCSRCSQEIPYAQSATGFALLRPLSHPGRARSRQKLILCRIRSTPCPHITNIGLHDS